MYFMVVHFKSSGSNGNTIRDSPPKSKEKVREIMARTGIDEQLENLSEVFLLQ